MLRLTGGTFRGRVIQTPKNDRTRPTQARLRQALFNSLQSSIPQAKVLDLFAGSGALGFEALSRGAEHVTFVEMDRSAIRVLEKNIETLKVQQQVVVVNDSVDSSVSRIRSLGPFDLILADPPYEGGWETKLLNTLPWRELLTEEGIFCLEWGVQKSIVSELPDELPDLIKVREKNYGDSMLSTFQKKTEEK
jgi:16S rRNA (guanine(966)-N(2))-methyltransferase RsmD